MKLKKANFEKWVKKESWTWWESVCLMCSIEPPKNLEEYFKMKKISPKIIKMEKDFREKGFESHFNCKMQHESDFN